MRADDCIVCHDADMSTNCCFNSKDVCIDCCVEAGDPCGHAS